MATGSVDRTEKPDRESRERQNNNENFGKSHWQVSRTNGDDYWDSAIDFGSGKAMVC